jgi:hypothetical protein
VRADHCRKVRVEPAEKVSRPGRCGLLAPAHPPGATRKVGRSTTGRSSGVSLRSTYTSPVVPEGSAGDAHVGPGAGRPAPQPIGAITGRPVTMPLRAGLVGEPTSVPEAGPCSGCPDQHPGAVHADPVARALVRWRLRTEVLRGSSWGAPVASARASLPVASGKPAARCTEAAVPLAAPVARCSSLRSVASRPARSRLRLVSRSRFPLCSARRLCSEDSVIQPRLACAPRYVGYTRECITPGQGVFSNPQGYPRTFS